MENQLDFIVLGSNIFKGTICSTTRNMNTSRRAIRLVVAVIMDFQVIIEHEVSASPETPWAGKFPSDRLQPHLTVHD